MSGQMLKRGVKAMPAEDHIRENPEKQLNLAEVVAEAVKCAQALKTDELITDTRVKEAFAELMNKVYLHLPESLQDQLIADFKLNILRRAQEKNTPPVELMDDEQKNFLGKKRNSYQYLVDYRKASPVSWRMLLHVPHEPLCHWVLNRERKMGSEAGRD